MSDQSEKIHLPVLLDEVLSCFQLLLQNPDRHSDLHIFDGTYGRGGHLSELVKLAPQAKIDVCDRDPEAVLDANTRFAQLISSGQMRVHHCGFAEAPVESMDPIDFAILDLGVSSPQLDQAERGFSFMRDGPLDMRMDFSKGISAADLVADLSEEELIKIFQELGEVHRPYRVVRAIVHDRKTKRFSSTKELGDLIARVDGWRRKGHHPATLYFQALRMAVNDELGQLERGLDLLLPALRPSGLMLVLTFHSLEDRLVKRLFRDRPQWGAPLHKKVIRPDRKETSFNSRARSAKMRVFEKKTDQELAGSGAIST